MKDMVRPKVGDITSSGNFKLVSKIESLDVLYIILQRDKSIYYRHRIYPCSWIINFSFLMLAYHVYAGNVFIIERINK